MCVFAERKSSKSERRSKDRDDAEEGKKKRKWGSSRTRRTSESKTISISTDSLKVTYICIYIVILTLYQQVFLCAIRIYIMIYPLVKCIIGHH